MKILKALFTVTLAGLASQAMAQAGSESGSTQACSATIEADDAYHFIPLHIDIPDTCKDFTVTLKHVGRLPKAAMGHNWVLTRKADMEPVAKDGILAGATNNYVMPNDQRVIAHTEVIGGGETTSIKFSVALLKPNESYVFFCSFGGHSPLMRGTVALRKTN